MIERTFQVRMQFDRSFLTDECYALHETTELVLSGIKEKIIEAKEKIAECMAPLKVHRIYMTNQEIKAIINNLKAIKQDIHPGEIRCSRDNALRDINHPFHTIYYKDKEVALVGTDETIQRALIAVHECISQDEEYLKHSFSLNYLLPECSKQAINDIKVRIEEEYRDKGAKLIVYEPQAPRKNVSLTLVANHRDFPAVYDALREMIDKSTILADYETFDAYQKKLLYRMTQYLFKYLQNYFQTKSIIFMKSWETIASDYGQNCSKYNTGFKVIKSRFIDDHELKFYILSVNRLTQNQGFKEVGLDWKDVVFVLKTMVNKTISKEAAMKVKNFQTVLNQSPNLREFIDNYKPSTYFLEYANEKPIDFEKRLRNKLLDQAELEEDLNDGLRRRETSYFSRPTHYERDPTKYSRTNYRGTDKMQSLDLPLELPKLEATMSAPAAPMHGLLPTISHQQSTTTLGRGPTFAEPIKLHREVAFMKGDVVSPSVQESDEDSSSNSDSDTKDNLRSRQKTREKRNRSSDSEDSRKMSRREKARLDYKLLMEKMEAARKESAKLKTAEKADSPRLTAKKLRDPRNKSSSSSSSSSKNSSSPSKSSKSDRSKSQKSSSRKVKLTKERRRSSSSPKKSEKGSPTRKIKYTFGGSDQKSASKSSKSSSTSKRSESESKARRNRISKFTSSRGGKDRRTSTSSSRSNTRRKLKDSRSRRRPRRDSSEERKRYKANSIDKSPRYKRAGFTGSRGFYLGKR